MQTEGVGLNPQTAHRTPLGMTLLNNVIDNSSNTFNA